MDNQKNVLRVKDKTLERTTEYICEKSVSRHLEWENHQLMWLEFPCPKQRRFQASLQLQNNQIHFRRDENQKVFSLEEPKQEDMISPLHPIQQMSIELQLCPSHCADSIEDVKMQKYGPCPEDIYNQGTK